MSKKKQSTKNIVKSDREVVLESRLLSSKMVRALEDFCDTHNIKIPQNDHEFNLLNFLVSITDKATKLNKAAKDVDEAIQKLMSISKNLDEDGVMDYAQECPNCGSDVLIEYSDCHVCGENLFTSDVIPLSDDDLKFKEEMFKSTTIETKKSNYVDVETPDMDLDDDEDFFEEEIPKKKVEPAPKKESKKVVMEEDFEDEDEPSPKKSSKKLVMEEEDDDFDFDFDDEDEGEDEPAPKKESKKVVMEEEDELLDEEELPKKSSTKIHLKVKGIDNVTVVNKKEKPAKPTDEEKTKKLNDLLSKIKKNPKCLNDFKRTDLTFIGLRLKFNGTLSMKKEELHKAILNYIAGK